MTNAYIYCIILLFSDCGEHCGSLAQLGEHLPYKQRVIGSSPIVPTIFLRIFRRYGPVVQLVRTPPCHGGGREFESHPGRQRFARSASGFEKSPAAQLVQNIADLAHLVERHLAKVEVASSSLVIRSSNPIMYSTFCRIRI